MEKKSGKASIESAIQLAKNHGVDVLGYNDKVGKEYVCCNGEPMKLNMLRKEMEFEGWHVVDTNEGECFMDFSLHSP